MSKKLASLMLTAGIATWAVFATGPGMTPTASGQQVLPGGQAAKIRSYGGGAAPSAWIKIIPNVEGDHGMIITDVVYFSGGLPADRVQLKYTLGTAETFFHFLYYNNTTCYALSLKSGITIPAGAEVWMRSLGGEGDQGFLLSGYIW